LRSLGTEPAVQGHDVQLTLDLDIQKLAEDSLAQGLQAAHSSYDKSQAKHFIAPAGSSVVLDPRDGSVLALASNPTYDPSIFVNGIKPELFAQLNDPASGFPLNNRVIQGQYAPGSTFKLATALAALSHGMIDDKYTVADGGSIRIGNRVFKNAGGEANGRVNITRALTVSSDVFFYQVGESLDSACGGTALQKWGRKLGISKPTGIDLPGEGSPNQGFLPTAAQINRLHKKYPNYFPLWTTGQAVNLAVGQGFVQADPLQMAVAYAGIATNYKVKPHLALRIDDNQGRAVQEFAAPARTPLGIPSPFRQSIMDGLFGAANDPKGTSYDVFKDFPIKVCGKTGTAQRIGKADQSWYVVLAPCPNPRYVVAVTDEDGGWGAQTAAPDARRILAALFGIKSQENKVVRGANQSR
jgi:penicillin-binding protein 2